MVVSEGVGCVRDSAAVSKGSRLDDATEILCFLFGSHMVACSWLGGCLLWGNRLKSGVDGGTVIELKFF